jgi:hypothetical protein
VDELEAELKALDREIARFVVEALQRDAPQALNAQLAEAMAAGLAPLQQSLESIGRNLAETRAELAKTARDTRADADARAAAQRETLAGFGAEISAALREGREARALQPPASAPPPPASPQVVLAPPEPVAAARRSDREPGRESDRAWWQRNPLLVVTGAIVFLLAAGLAVYLLNPSGLPGLGPRTAAAVVRPPAGGEATPVVGDGSPEQQALDRILAQVNLWSGERRKAALQALCGATDETNPTGCPTVEARWEAEARPRSESEAALTAAVAALAESDGCAPLTRTGAVEPSSAPAAPPAHAAHGADGAHGARAEGPPTAGPDPQATLRCLLTEAGRAPRP